MRRRIYILFLLLGSLLVLGGCSVQNVTALDIAVQSYTSGNYAAAEGYFLEALESGSAGDVERLGHACNLVNLGESVKAADELLMVQDSFDDINVKIRIREILLELYLQEQNYAGAARVCSEIARLAPEAAMKDEYELKASVIRADMYRESGMDGALEEELRNLIALKLYAGNEYLELYEKYVRKDLRSERLALADEIAVYMKGHSAYVDDFRPIIGVMLDAANVAGYTEWEYTEDDYFEKAEQFIELAEKEKFTSTDMIRYKIIIAERKGKLELAGQLLGVYLNHYPDDVYAKKELSFIENRLR